jgi:hypothetical protein
MNERGAGLVVVLMLVLLLSAIGLALVMAAVADVQASGNLRSARIAFYAADAAIERVLPDLHHADWDLVLSGALTSRFADGPAGGGRTLPDGRTLVLDEVLNLANCGVRTACGEAAMSAVTEDRPWGADNPRWRLFAWGPFSSLAGPEAAPYLVVMVADDPLDSDGDPARDARGASPGRGVLLVRAVAHDRGGASRVIEASVARTGLRPAPQGYTGQRGGPGHTTGETAAGPGPGTGSLPRTEMPVTEREEEER